MTDKKEKTYTEFKIKAKLEWARVFEQNRDMHGYNGAYEKYDGACTVDALVDEENLQIMIDAGSQTAENVYDAAHYSGKSADKLKKKAKVFTEDGLYRVAMKRPFKTPIPTIGGPPAVRHADGRTNWDLEEDGAIGNGSEAFIYGTVYESKGLKGVRLDGIQILDLVPYESDYSPGPRMGDYSAPVESKPTPKPSTKTEEILEDELPF